MKHMYKTLLAMLMVLTSFANAQITVDATAGTLSSNYTTLKAAFDAINIGTHQGSLNIRVHQNTTEILTCLLDSSGNSTGSNYTSLLIRPADTATVVKTISFTVAGQIGVSVAGADNLTIDGRPLGTGNQKLLSFTHSGTIANSHNISLTNGVRNFWVTYTLFTNATTTAVVASNIILNTSTSPSSGHNNIRVEYCKLTGARAGIYFSSTTINTMDSIFIVKNEIVDFANAAILSTTGSFKRVIIDSNIIYQTFNSATAPTGIDIRHNAVGTDISITNNRIFDMQTATTSFMRGIVVSPATLGTGTIILVANNFISLMKDGGSAANIRGFEFAGAGDASCSFINNSVRIGGTHSLGTAGGVAPDVWVASVLNEPSPKTEPVTNSRNS
jgi:hypothetical protein